MERTIAWREAGVGEPALLLHCALGHSGAFGEVMDLLADRLAMRALDLPGHGGTDFDPARGVQAQAAADGLSLIEGPTHLIGHSFGGTVALRIAIEAPERVASLTLIEPVLFASLREADPDVYAAERGARPDLASFLARWGGPMTDRALDYAEARMGLVERSTEELFEAWPAEEVAALRCPVLLIRGADSPSVIARIFDVVAAAFVDSRTLVVPGAGHMVPITHPGPVADAIRRFLDQSRKSAAE